jgi:hypothetical protein
MNTAKLSLVALLAFAAPIAQAHDDPRCKRIRADLVEVLSTEGCKPEHTSCYLGEVDGNHGLDGVTYFKGDPVVGKAPPGAPDATPYSGAFEYHTDEGSLFLREAGIVPPGFVTAIQRIAEGTGEFAGATGYFFVSGTRASGVITTEVTGQLCLPGDGHDDD